MITANILQKLKKKAAKQSALEDSWLNNLQAGPCHIAEWIAYFSFHGHSEDQAVMEAFKLSLTTLLQQHPEFKSIFLSVALWAAFGTELTIGKNIKIPTARKYLKIIFTDSSADLIADNCNGTYAGNTIILAKTNKEIIRTIVHELTHAIANLEYDNESKLHLAEQVLATEEWEKKFKLSSIRLRAML